MTVFLSLLFLLLHAASLLLFPAHAPYLSFVFLVSAPLLAAALCLHRSLQGGARIGWRALGLGLLLWAGGMAVAMAGVLFGATPDALPGLSMLLYVLYGVPLTFALASHDDDAWHLRLVDAALVLVLGTLFFVYTFTFADPDDDNGLRQLRLMFDVENLFIVLFAFVRYVASVDAQSRAFFRSLLSFACVYLLVAGYINHFQHESDYGTPVDVLIDLPFAWLAVAASRTAGTRPASHVSERLTHVVRAGSPLMLPISVLVVSALLVKTHATWAVAGFVVALVGYGLRSVLTQVRSIEQHRQLDALARIDPLTGLANRRQFDEALQREWARARRAGEGIALLMLDIDHFKRVNDSFGHQTGDTYVRAVADALAAGITRAGDLVARYGGEEFVVLLPGCSIDGARDIAERMRARVESLRLESPMAGEVMTVSVGVSAMDAPSQDSASALIEAADAALYDAKHAGRNRVALLHRP